MSKRRSVIWRVMFVLFLIAPTILYFAFRDKLPEMNYENKEEPTFPSITEYGYEEYPEALTAYYNEEMPFRNQMIAVNNYGWYRIFHDSASPKVVLGKENWLFYNDPEDGTNIQDYKGLAFFSQEYMTAVATNLTETEKVLSKKDCEFWLLIVPDKDHVYSEEMPDYIPGPNLSRAGVLMDFLAEHTKLKVIYPLPDLLNYKDENEEESLYFHYDTHWNPLGAYVGTKPLLSAMGESPSSLWELSVEEKNDSEYDLADLLCIRDFLHDDVTYEITDPVMGEAELLEYDEMGTIRYRAEGENVDPRKVLVIRDSFGEQMLPHFSRYFAETVSERRDHSFIYATQDQILEQEKPDVLVFEISERYLGYLLGWRYY